MNHPNFRWSVRLDDLLDIPDSTLMEIWNGHPGVYNLGGTDSSGRVAPSAEASWDSLLTRGKVIFGVGDDDSHYFIIPTGDIRYRTEFIGSGRKVIATSNALHPRCTIMGSEGYVRARVTDSVGRTVWALAADGDRIAVVTQSSCLGVGLVMTPILPPRSTSVARATATLCATMLVAAACSGGGSSSPTSPSGTTTPANTTVANVAITGSSSSVGVGASAQLGAAAQNSAGTAVAVTFSWSSSNTAVATVGTATGLVTGVAVGSATITATAGGVSGTRTMTVTAPAPPPSSAQVDMPGTSFQPGQVTIAQGGTIAFVFTAVGHNVLFGAGSGALDIAVTTNASVARTFNAKGTFSMTCTVHAGMSGTITVQ